MNDLDRLVQLAGEAFVDTRAVHNRFRLAVSLPDHSDHVWLRVRAGHQEEAAMESGIAVRHQPCDKPDFHANPVWAEELATGCR